MYHHLQVNGVRKGSLSVPSEMCDSVNRESLQTEAIKVALEQNMLCNSDMKYMWHLMVELLILPIMYYPVLENQFCLVSPLLIFQNHG